MATKFIRVRGRVVPIKEKSESHTNKPKKQKKDVLIKFTPYKRDVGTRAKEGVQAGAAAGALIGGISGAQFGLRGLAAGTAIGAATIGALGAGLAAAFGARKGLKGKIYLVPKNKNKGGTSV